MNWQSFIFLCRFSQRDGVTSSQIPVAEPKVPERQNRTFEELPEEVTTESALSCWDLVNLAFFATLLLHVGPRANTAKCNEGCACTRVVRAGKTMRGSGLFLASKMTSFMQLSQSCILSAQRNKNHPNKRSLCKLSRHTSVSIHTWPILHNVYIRTHTTNLFSAHNHQRRAEACPRKIEQNFWILAGPTSACRFVIRTC